MQRLTINDQIQINEIIRTLRKWKLKVEPAGAIEEVLLKIFKEDEVLQVWVLVKPDSEKFKFEQLDCAGLMFENLQPTYTSENGFFGNLMIRDDTKSTALGKRKSRKPGPDLRPH